MEWGTAARSAATALALLAFAGAARAERFDFIVFENDDGADVSGLDLWVDVLDAGGGQVDFVFHNDSSIESTVSEVYFEDTSFSSGALSNGVIQGESSGVDFTDESLSPPNPPGSISGFGGAWGGTLYGAEAVPPPSFNGLDPGELLTIRFDLSGSFADLVAGLFGGDFRIAQHVIALPNDASVWTVVVPLPPAFWPGAAALASVGLLGYVRRRRMS